MTIRPAVLAFAHEMEDRLLRHDAKRGTAGWSEESDEFLLMRLREEVRELAIALERPCACRSAGECDHVPSWSAIRQEAADVANFAMMIADACGSLEGLKHRAEASPAST